MPSEIQQSLFKDLVAEIPDQHKAEFYRTLHEAGISPNDMELAKLLKALQLYKSYYETIPAAVLGAADRIKQLKHEIEHLSDSAHDSSEAGAKLAGQVVQEAEKVRQGLTEIHRYIEAALRQSAENLASRMAELLSAGIEKTVLLPLKSRLNELAQSSEAFVDAIARNNQAAASLEKSTNSARRFHLGTYVLGGCLIACSLVLVSWFFIHRWYADRIEQERAALVEQIRMNDRVLTQLSKSHRTLELRPDPQNPNRKLLVMKNASGWQSTSKCGVIEFAE